MSAGVIHVTLLGLAMIGVYTTLSGLAGVYSEYILKGKYEVGDVFAALLDYFNIIAQLLYFVKTV